MAKSDKKKITPEITKQIADVLGLDIDEARAAELAPQIQALRDGIDAMDELELTDVEPAPLFPMRQE